MESKSCILLLTLVNLLWLAHYSTELERSSPSVFGFFTMLKYINLYHPPYFKQMVVDTKKSGFVYIGATNRIFQLDANLSLVASAKTTPEHYNADCKTKEECETKGFSGMELYTNFILVINYDYGELVSCTLGIDDRRLTWAAWNLENITKLERNTTVSPEAGWPDFGFVAPGTSNAAKTRNVVYVGWTSIQKLTRVSSHSLNPEDNFRKTFTLAQYRPSAGYIERFKYGFSSKGSSYFLSQQIHIDKPSCHIPRLIRVCHNNSIFHSYADIPIIFEAAPEQMNLETVGAHFGLAGADLARELKIDMEEHVLFVLFSEQFRHSSNSTTYLCIYSMRHIEDAFLENLREVTSTADRRDQHDICKFDSKVPLYGTIPVLAQRKIVLDEKSHKHESIITTTSEDATVIYVGVADKRCPLKKFLLIGSSVAVLYFFSAEGSFGVVEQIAFDSTEQYLYFLGNDTVYKISASECAHLKTLESCIEAPDPLCGWCTKLKRCTSKKSCFPNQKLQQESADDRNPWITCTTRNTKRLSPLVSDNPLEVEASNSVDVPTGCPSICYKSVECLFSGNVSNSTPGQGINETDMVRCPIPKELLTISSRTKTVELQITVNKKGLLPSNATFTRSIAIRGCLSYFSSEDCKSSILSCIWNSRVQECTAGDTIIDPTTDTDPLLKTIMGACFGVGVLALTIVGVVFRKRRENQEECCKKAKRLFLEQVPLSIIIPPGDIDLTDAKELGSGEFGTVSLAKYRGNPAAIKSIKDGRDKDQLESFLKEIQSMIYIGEHAHILQMYGVEISNLEEGGILVVLELSPHGNLESYLSKHESSLSYAAGSEEIDRPINFSNLADWSRQIAHGLAYLEVKQVVHGDLATRNVLLFHDNVVKVSDFGFSRKIYRGSYTKFNKQACLPFQWAAPETLDKKIFTSQTDVWSYGVTVWEIFSLANCPFPNENWDTGFVRRLREGMRLEKPEMATEEIYQELMLNCWEINPNARLTFSQICGF